VRRRHCTITPSVVRATARDALEAALPWKPYGQLVTVARLLGLLLLAAAIRRSLSAVAERFAFGFGRETARNAVAANLPGLDALTAGLVDALHLFRSRAWRRRRWDVAADLHYCPFYGDRATAGIVGGQKKQGTNYFYCYATAVLIHPRHRYTVGLLPLASGAMKPHDVVAALLDQMASRGLNVRGVVLDSGFDSALTILLLQGRGLSYAVPLRRKGDKANPRNDWFLRPEGDVSRLTWRAKRGSRRAVSTEAVVRVRQRDGKVQVLAFGGWGQQQAGRALQRRARQAGRKYGARFGIETGYRQMNEGKGRTTKKDVCYRLLLVGIALLLRQVWVWLSGQVARARGLGRWDWVSELPLADVLDFLASALERTYKKARAVHLGRPLDPLPNFRPLPRF
jgi:Transposase DDE domain